MSKQRQPDNRRGLYASIAVLAGVILFIVLAIVPNYAPNRLSQAGPQVMATLDPAIIANLTRVPQMQPLDAVEAQALNDLQTQVDACGDYSEARREQMGQHIDWLLTPSTIPPEILIAAGQNPLGRLIFGMAVFTSSEWRLLHRPAESCLITVGRTLNEMLIAADELPFTIYDE